LQKSFEQLSDEEKQKQVKKVSRGVPFLSASSADQNVDERP
jgi:hypothetical protein